MRFLWNTTNMFVFLCEYHSLYSYSLMSNIHLSSFFSQLITHTFKHTICYQDGKQDYNHRSTHPDTNTHTYIIWFTISSDSGISINFSRENILRVHCWLACIDAKVCWTAVTGDEHCGGVFIEVASTRVAASQWSKGQVIDLDAHEDVGGAQTTEGSARGSFVGFIIVAVDTGSG